MVEECRRVNADSEAWLTAVLRRLPNYQGDYLDLLPGILPLPGIASPLPIRGYALRSTPFECLQLSGPEGI